MSKNHFANWTKMAVMEGGTGNLTLGAVTGFPTIASTLGTNKHFHYALLNTNLSPIEIGQGVMTNATTLQRDTVEAAMIAGDFITDGTKADVPVGAVMFTAPTANSLLELVLEQKTIDYGNVSGAVTLDFKNACIVANITADTTFTVDTATLPPAGTHHEIILKLKSNNNPALTTPFQAGFMVTLGGNRFFIDGGVTAYPSMRLLGAAGSEMTLRLTNIAGGTNYRVENISKHEHVHNMGVVAGNITLDIRRPWNIAELTGSDATATINAISPDVGVLEPAHFTIVNNGSVLKTIAFNTNILSIAGSTLSQVTLPIGFKLDLDVRRNPLNGAISYEASVGDVNYNQTASGFATTWNPSDYSGTPPLTLSAGNRTVEMTTSTTITSSARAFGQKNTGKHVFSVRCDSVIGGSTTSNLAGTFAVGIASPGVSLALVVGGAVNSGGLRIARLPIAVTTWDDNASTARSAFLPSVGDYLSIAYDAATGRGWVALNDTWLYSGNPETGANPIFTLAPSNFYMPMISFLEQSQADMGRWTLLTELQVQSLLATIPSFRYWAA